MNNKKILLFSLNLDQFLNAGQFSDGTFEESYKLFSNTVLKANIGDRSLVTLGISSGAYERKARVEFSYDGLIFSFLNSQGLSGQKDYWAAGVQYNLLPFKNSGIGIKNTNSPSFNLTSSSAVLDAVSSRPVEFPHTFTVKTDPTSVRLVSSITKGTITWQSSGVLGTFFDSAAPSRQSISIQLQSTNSSGYAVEYDTTLVSGSLPAGLTLSAGGLISGTASAITLDTTYTFQVKAKSSGASDVTSPALSIIIKAPNSITWASSGSLGDFNDSASPSRSNVQIQLSATSTTGATVTYATSVASGALPPGLSISSEGVISGTAAAVAADTTYTFTINAFATDAPTQISPSLSITVRKPQNISWTSSGALGTYYDSAAPSRSGISIQLQASSSNGGVVSFETSLASGSLPPGLTLSSTGLVSGTASAVIVDTTYTFQVVATSPNVPSSTSTALSITIKAPNIITWASTGIVGTFNDSSSPSRSNISIQLSTTSSTGSSVTYDTTVASGSLPPGLTLSSSGLITGTASAVLADTTYTFTLTANSVDSISTESPALSIVIRPPVSIQWVSSGQISSFTNCQTNSINHQLSVNATGSSSISFSIASGSLPSGVSLNSSGLVTGYPLGINTDQIFSFTVIATDSSGVSSTSNSLSIQVLVDGYFYNSTNSHYYKSVSASGMTWQQAKVAAESLSCGTSQGSNQGYLATITTDSELSFIDTVVYSSTKPDNIFLGGSDVAVDGNWRWVTGPEASLDNGQGALFSIFDQPTSGYIAPWYSTSQTGSYLFIYSFNVPKFNPWNGSLEAPGRGGLGGYLVEFGN